MLNLFYRTSPAAFYEFSSVRILVVPAVTDQSGKLVCTTTSTYIPPCPDLGYPELQFTGINAYAESYFGGSSNNSQLSNSTIVASGNLSNCSPYSIAEIQFPTPFVYLPLEGAQESLGSFPDVEVATYEGTVYFGFESTPPATAVMGYDNSDEDYGYVPQDLIDWMARIPKYLSRYPYLASCYPGGPSIKPDSYHAVNGECTETPVAPVYQSPVLDLTTSTQISVSSAGCFHPGACPTPAPAATPTTAVPANTALPSSSQEATGARPAPEQSQKEQAAVTSSGTTAPGIGGMIASALGGLPFGPSPSAFSPKGPSPNAPSPNAPVPSAISASLNTPSPYVTISSTPYTPPQNSPAANPESGQNPPSGYAISLAPSASVIVINGVKMSFPTAEPDSGNVESPIFTVGSQSVTYNSASQLAVAGQTLTPGAPAITIQGTPVSLEPSGDAVVVAGNTLPLPPLVSAPTVSVAVASQPIILNSLSQYIVAGKTLIPGAPPISIKGTPVSLAPSASAVIVAGSTIALPVGVNGPVISVGDQPVTANSASQYIFGSKTLIPGGPAITVSGMTISLAPSGTQAVIDDSTTRLIPVSPSLPSLVLGSHTFTANAASAYVIGGQTLVLGQPGINVPGSAIGILTLPPEPSQQSFTAGDQVFTPHPIAFSIAGTTLSAGGPGVTISGTSVSLGPSGSLVIGTSTTILPSGTSPPVFTVGGQVFSPSPIAFSIAGTTVSAGGRGVTISGTPVSLGPSGSLVIGTSVTDLYPTAFTVGDQVFAPNPTAFLVAGTIISAGGPGVTISGTPLSLGPSGGLIIGTSVTSLNPTAFTVGGQVFTPNPAAFPIAGTTISAGGPGVTISGTPVSLGPSAGLVVGNSTVQLSPTSPGGPNFEGRASRKSMRLEYRIISVMITSAMMLCL